jgi:hypothetical protein
MKKILGILFFPVHCLYSNTFIQNHLIEIFTVQTNNEFKNDQFIQIVPLKNSSNSVKACEFLLTVHKILFSHET